MTNAQAWVEDGARFGQGVKLAAMAVIKKEAILGDGVSVDHFAVVGGLPQDIHFDPQTESFARIGDNTVLREGVTVHRSASAGGQTLVGANCFLMANAHVAHDCVVEDRVILANGVLLGGHVHIGTGTFIGGNAVVHQFVNIGRGAIISGGARMAVDVPPYCIANNLNEVAGLNLIGLKRSGISKEDMVDLRYCYRAVYFHPGSLQKKASAALAAGHGTSEQGRHFLETIAAGSKRGFCRSHSERSREKAQPEA